VLTRARESPTKNSSFEEKMLASAKHSGSPETFIDTSIKTEPPEVAIRSTFGKVLSNSYQAALKELLEENSGIEPSIMREIEGLIRPQEAQPGPEGLQSILRNGIFLSSAEKEKESFKGVSSASGQILDDNVVFYREGALGTNIEISPKEELTGDILSAALGELIWFILVSQLDATGLKREIGLFSGDRTKEELIENVLRNRLESLGKRYEDGLTFKELTEFKDHAGKPLFKPLYITAFNTSTLRTDIFSAEHTPNVVVADAVRASMSIPVFLTPVTVRENGVPRRAYFNDGRDSEEIRYLDGGVLDNYPIWMFDELKYFFEDPSSVKLKERIQISNPRTLGFMILDRTRIEAFTEPYYDYERTKVKRVNKMNYQGTLDYIVGTLFNTYLNEVETNQFRRREDAYRSLFVDSLGMRALSFNLTEAEKQRIIEASKQAVEEYQNRFSIKVSFTGLNAENVVNI